MTVLAIHDDVVFDDAVIYLTGNAYRGCKFNRCTFVLRSDVYLLSSCHFATCTWHIDLLIHDKKQVEFLIGFLSEMIKPSLPRLADDDTKTSL